MGTTHCLINTTPSFGYANVGRQFMLQMALDPAEVVSEIYSPPRVTEAAKRFNLGIAPGFVFDLTCENDNGKAWDFDDLSRRQEARRRLRIQRPMFFIGSPRCTAFPSWQLLNATRRDPARYTESG